MEDLNLIEKVSEPTEWVSPMVVARKSNGDIRICLDPYDLNKAVKRQHFRWPKKYFQELDWLCTSPHWMQLPDFFKFS
jgi:hypothetical protein